MRVRLLDTVPIIFERLSLIPDKGEPAVLLSHRDTVGLGENTYQGQRLMADDVRFQDRNIYRWFVYLPDPGF